MTYTASATTNVNVTIIGDIATLVPVTNWYGTEKVTFTADDSNSAVDSNEVLLNVTKGCFVPVSGMSITENTTFCSGTYQI